MDTSSIQPVGYSLPASPAVGAQEASERRQVVQAAKTVNESGILGQNQLVFMLDPKTRRPVFRVEDRQTHTVVFQAPPEYVLRLAETLGKPAQTSDLPADT
ncbi:MAG TPA: flagellar protein FlaG [Bryobacteraceae bacterium]|nr:flagellar protein FlaG [Bryobacteraceae bacterium]